MYSVDRSSIFFYVHVQLFQHHLLKRLYSVHQITVILFSKISCSCVWIYLWILYSVSLIFFFYIDADTVSHTPSYYSFMMSLEIRWCWSSNCVLLKDFPSLSSENKARVHVQSSSSSSLPGQGLERISKNNCSPSSASLLSSNSCPGDPLKP